MGSSQSQNSVSNDDDKTIAEKKRAALDLVLDAWCEGIEKGIDGEILAHASLFAALSDLVELYGEEAVAKLAARLPERITNGEFTLVRQIQ